jgi:hypothetical protein
MSVSLEVRPELLKQMSSLLLGTVVLALAAHAAVPKASFNAPRSYAVPIQTINHTLARSSTSNRRAVWPALS